jgi:MFS family permease
MRQCVVQQARTMAQYLYEQAEWEQGEFINVGDFVYGTTLLVWVFALTHSAIAISGVLIAQYAPIFAPGPIAGVFVDRWNRRTTMIAVDVARAGVALLPFITPFSCAFRPSSPASFCSTRFPAFLCLPSLACCRLLSLKSNSRRQHQSARQLLR